jgi:predicted O-methyltransferase YrrM
MDQILDIVASKFENRDIATDVILPNIKLLDTSSRQSPAFNDPKYLPFYYRLGCEIKPKKVLQFGSKIGLISAAFLKGCRTVDEWFFIDENKTYLNIIESNLKLNGCNKIKFRFLDKNPIENEEKFELYADIALIAEEYDSKKLMTYMNFAWNSLKSDCLLVVDYIQKSDSHDAFMSFCEIKNRTPVFFKTRYKVGILTK